MDIGPGAGATDAIAKANAGNVAVSDRLIQLRVFVCFIGFPSLSDTC